MTTTLYPAYRQAIATLIDAGLSDGDILTKRQLAKMFGLQEPVTAAEQVRWQAAWFTQMQDFRDELLSVHRLALKTQYGDSSYQVIPANEQTSHAMQTGAKEIAKAMRRVGRTLIFVRHDRLTASEAKQNTDALAKVAMLSGMVRKTRLLS